MFKKIFYISFYSVKEFFSSRIFYLIVFFIFFSLFISSIIGVMGVGDEKRILSDFFVSSIYMVGLLFSLIYPPFSLNLEIETKRIYLIISKSVTRFEWYISKIISFIVSLTILILSAEIISSVFLKITANYFFDSYYLKTIMINGLKITTIICISASFSIIFSSQYVAVMLSLMIWIISNFSVEIKNSLSYIKKTHDYFLYLIYLFPDFSVNNLNLNVVIHFLGYSIFVILLGLFFLNKKEL